VKGMTIGATGTRDQLTDAQIGWAYQTFEDSGIAEVHHGACTGADELIHQIALECGARIHVWPPLVAKYLATTCLIPHPLVTVHEAMDYLARDREVVQGGVTGLIALPRQETQPGPLHWGGTWYTVNFAERMGRPVRICYPSGRTEIRQPERF
jgi:hypothetical protein